MTTALKIDFISDVSCPWCVIGLRALDQALEALGDEVQAHIHFQPFELNPNMPAEGQDIKEHIAEKYGSTPEQIEGIHQTIRERGAELGFTFASGERRIYTTFDAHRLLHWAEQQGKQHALKQALFEAYFSDLKDPSNHQTLADVAQKVGLDRLRLPVLVVHGTADPLLPVMHGVHVAAHIQGSQLRLIPGLAHRFQEAFKAPLLGAVLPYLKAQHEDGRNLAQL